MSRQSDPTSATLGCFLFLASGVVCGGLGWFLCTHYGIEDPVTIMLVTFVGTFFAIWPVMLGLFMGFAAIVIAAAMTADWLHS